MTEDEARTWVEQALDVPRETMARLDEFASLLRSENESQNLVSRATLGELWQRHIVDSAQLLRSAPSPEASWIDLGTGAGFPGLIVAALHQGAVTLVEERRLRIDFLTRAAALLGVSERTQIIGRKVERIDRRVFDVISARAFAPLPKLLELGSRFSTNKTRWILPKGRNARSELEAALTTWQGDFRIEPSLTDPDAGIIVAEGVRRKTS
ncbi:MAG TPA: 16S rRNA (guanine(527)-N(7))-methyltransferase RsmG [Allosphingosinicella sp.]|jgi:16S rRNA (guanine527-N7)-methyltransferase|nr:16S rRNA (guanine(527)-N(7))-methyltransferase RsmG [Allosphingosinicella sp.]